MICAFRVAAESDRLGSMESPARQVSLVPPPDRRQSETALAIARGTARLLRSLGFSCVSELPLPSGRRADLDRRDQVIDRGSARRPEVAGLPGALRPAVLRLHPGPAVRDFSGGNRADRRRRLWRAYALRGAGASSAGADPQADDGSVRDRRRAADQSADRSARARGVLEQHYRGARLAKMRCRVRRCMFSRRAVSETLRLHIS
jgi:DNA repair protein MmcB-like